LIPHVSSDSNSTTVWPAFADSILLVGLNLATTDECVSVISFHLGIAPVILHTFDSVAPACTLVYKNNIGTRVCIYLRHRSSHCPEGTSYVYSRFFLRPGLDYGCSCNYSCLRLLAGRGIKMNGVSGIGRQGYRAKVV